MGQRRKKKPKPFKAVTAIKALARERVGTPKPGSVVPDKKKKSSEKHKVTLGQMLSTDE